MPRTIVHQDQVMNLAFGAKSAEYPAGRCAFLDDAMVFPELRFTPIPGQTYECNVRFFQKEGRSRMTGIAFPINIDVLTDDEYDRESQVMVAVTFLQEQDSCPIAQHPFTGAYIFPTKDSEFHIRPGVQCWVTLVQKGSILVAHFIRNVETVGEEPPLSDVRTLARRDPSFVQMAEEAIADKYGQGKPPLFRFQGKNSLPWNILGVPKTAELEAIKKAYRKIIRTLHPDTNPNVNVDDYKAMVHAYDWLCAHQEWIERIAHKAPKPTPATVTEAKPVPIQAPPTPVETVVEAKKPITTPPPTSIEKPAATPALVVPEPVTEPIEPTMSADTRLDSPLLAPVVNGIGDKAIAAMIDGGVETLGQLAATGETALQDILGGRKAVKIGVVRNLINTAKTFIAAMAK